MRHPNEGTLRRLVDEPAGVADREHVAGCPESRSALAGVGQDGGAPAGALHVEAAPDVDAAWHRLSTAAAEQPRRRTAPAPTARRWRGALRSPVMAVVAVIAL